MNLHPSGNDVFGIISIQFHGSGMNLIIILQKMNWHFKVVAQTDDPNLNFHSDYITGRSYDNIAPPAPNGLDGIGK